MEIFKLHPDKYAKGLDDLVMFLAQVAHCYTDELKQFPQELMSLLTTHNTVLEPAMRMVRFLLYTSPQIRHFLLILCLANLLNLFQTFCRSLILLRNKNLLAPTDLLSLFFQLLRCQDKQLRHFLETHIITDIKTVNAKHKNTKLNTVNYCTH